MGLQQIRCHKTSHLSSPKLHTENSFSSNITKYLGGGISPFQYLDEALNLSCITVSLWLKKHRPVQKHILS